MGELQTIKGTKQPADITLFFFLHHHPIGVMRWGNFQNITRKKVFSKNIFLYPHMCCHCLNITMWWHLYNAVYLALEISDKKKTCLEERGAQLLMTCRECRDKEIQKFNCNSFQAKFSHLIEFKLNIKFYECIIKIAETCIVISINLFRFLSPALK